MASAVIDISSWTMNTKNSFLFHTHVNATHETISEDHLLKQFLSVSNSQISTNCDFEHTQNRVRF